MSVLEEPANRSLLKVLRLELKGKARSLPRELRFIREAAKTLPLERNRMKSISNGGE